MTDPQTTMFPDFESAGRPKQDAELERVSGRIAKSIQQFFRVTLADSKAAGVFPVFLMDDLLQWVTKEVGNVAPDSPGRIMRHLRDKKLINYRVVNRAQSLYEVLPNKSQG